MLNGDNSDPRLNRVNWFIIHISNKVLSNSSRSNAQIKCHFKNQAIIKIIKNYLTGSTNYEKKKMTLR